jgi:drug/metabolite transporter (DMT)-like permease
LNSGFLWIAATIIAAAAQTARNAMQTRLTGALGTIGAAQVRFLYGFPFALMFLWLVQAATGEAMPHASGRFVAFVTGGALAQIMATVLMLAAMRERSFAVTIAYTKTEPVQVALFGLLVVGDPLTLAGALAIVVATAGVVVMSVKPGAEPMTAAGLRPALYGIVSGACFALAAVGFRGAILALDGGSFMVRATTTLVWALGLQSCVLAVYLALANRAAFVGSLKTWRPSLFAGFMGAFASQFWFLGFALTAAANVRTLGLVEVLFAQIVARRVFSQAVSAREIAGMLIIVAGVALLLLGQGGP